jgi:DNA-binding NtrC family response regulator
MSGKSILLVEDDHAMSAYVRDMLVDEGYEVSVANTGEQGLSKLQSESPDLVITDLELGGEIRGLDVLDRARSLPNAPEVIVMTAFATVDTAIRALKSGAAEYLTKPFRAEALQVAVQRAVERRFLRGEVARLQNEVEQKHGFHSLVGGSPGMQRVFDLIRRIAASPGSVLITGESGTGKELVAKAIHYQSPRKTKPFVAVNCAALPDTLLESELFGHVKGAFTDARADRIGLFREADTGTLFLDEVSEISPAMQAKLLRALQEQEVRPIGSEKSIKVDVRVVAASNRSAEELREGKVLRQDLYYRLNVFHLALPPLRERGDDILRLSTHFINISAKRLGIEPPKLSDEAVRSLLRYRWPGNVRELENAMERAVTLARGAIDPADLPESLQAGPSGDFLDMAVARRFSLNELETIYIRRVLAEVGGNKSQAASILGIDRSTLYRKLEDGDSAEEKAARAG